jgi:hypothetical protein
VSRTSWHLLQEQAFLHLLYEHTAKVRNGFILSGKNFGVMALRA